MIEANGIALGITRDGGVSFGLILLLGPDHGLAAIGIVATPHAGLGAIVKHWRTDVRGLKGGDQLLGAVIIGGRFGRVIIGVGAQASAAVIAAAAVILDHAGHAFGVVTVDQYLQKVVGRSG